MEQGRVIKLVKRLKDREITCCTFLQHYEPKFTYEDREVLTELSKYPENEACVICFRCIAYNGYYQKYLDKKIQKQIFDKFDKLLEEKYPQLISAYQYYSGSGCGTDLKEEIMKEAYEKGDGDAAYRLGLSIEHIFTPVGSFVRGGYKELSKTEMDQCFHYYTKATEKGCTVAYIRMAELYYLSGDMDKAYELYLKNEGGGGLSIQFRDAIIQYLQTKLLERDKYIDELLYEPGGRKYRKAEEHFLSCVK